ncbi:MAG TPA: LacI family DNA-binding transcriptional regulator [Cytophagales bacterium]|nr:LacI family DNA-binding transcriptional regulator [Cytophagales bacterium]
MKASQVTLKDIAKRLNLSTSTVSRALQNNPNISPETKKLVVDLAKELDYRPNALALSLLKRKSHMLGVIVPTMGNNFFSTTMSGIEEVANECGYQVLICQSNEKYEREVANTDTIVSNHVDGILVSVSQETRNYDHFRALYKKGIPLVFFDRVSDDEEVSKVILDDFDAAFQVVDHLVKSGAKKIAHIAGRKTLLNVKKRVDGYKAALEKNNIKFDPALVTYTGFNKEDGINGFNEIYKNTGLPDAIFAVCDDVAVGAYLSMRDKGIKVPEDVLLAGFNDDPITSIMFPTLTTIHQKGYEIGKAATRMLIQQIESDFENEHPRQEVLKGELIIRESTQRKSTRS